MPAFCSALVWLAAMTLPDALPNEAWVNTSKPVSIVRASLPGPDLDQSQALRRGERPVIYFDAPLHLGSERVLR